MMAAIEMGSSVDDIKLAMCAFEEGAVARATKRLRRLYDVAAVEMSSKVVHRHIISGARNKWRELKMLIYCKVMK